MLHAGKINELKVVRKSDLGFMLSDNFDEVLLHFNDNVLGELEIGKMVDAFLFYDKKHRLCATTKKPFVTLNKPGLVEIKEVISGTGVFVDINTSKDVLISTDYLPYDFNLWPNVGDNLLVSLKVKNDTLLAKPLNKYEILEHSLKDVRYELNEYVDGYIFHINEDGLMVETIDFKHIFIHKTMFRGHHHLGEKLNVKIINIKNDDEYNGSLIAQKENMIDSDREIILSYLKAHNNQMDLDSKSQSEDVERILKLSRKAFKRALGGLYKDEIIYFENGKTYLK
jgi:predicted RNA-binding protein (virulence factor B family)